jgi:hypothetical protein
VGKCAQLVLNLGSVVGTTLDFVRDLELPSSIE